MKWRRVAKTKWRLNERRRNQWLEIKPKNMKIWRESVSRLNSSRRHRSGDNNGWLGASAKRGCRKYLAWRQRSMAKMAAKLNLAAAKLIEEESRRNNNVTSNGQRKWRHHRKIIA